MTGLFYDGIMTVGSFGRLNTVKMLQHLEGCQRWNNHVKQSGEPVPENPSSTCWSMEDVLQAPGWLEQALVFLPRAADYLNASPILYSVNAFTTYPKEGPTQGDIQEFHRDNDDVRFVALFCYLTDVWSPDDGPHQFESGTHNGCSAHVNGGRETIYGPAGTMFLADTRGLHRGIRPTTGPRTMAWARFGVTDPPASYGWDKLAPIPSSLLGDRYSKLSGQERNCIRLIVKE